jgi:tRNA(fMet)-specific endonuclease VapC
VAVRYLLDTNICIYIRQNRPPVVGQRFRALPADSASISVITYGELRYGVERSGARDRALQLLLELATLLPVAPLPALAGAAYGEIRALLSRQGKIISNNDLWIAAHARTAGLTLVTNNEREFSRVPGLKVENWASA